MTPVPRFVIIGAGMAGILSAIKLQEAGLTDFTVYEKADRLGGTWRDNTYPGIACDVPSHLYTYSFAPNPDWTHMYSPGPEIWDYFSSVAQRYGVDRYIRYGEEVTRLEFGADGRWLIDTATGGTDAADFVIAATGVLHHPSYPDIAGIDSFAGALFHSSRWDHGVDISGKRVAVVGTGSSAIQIVGAVVDEVAGLSLFQRTPQWIMPVENPPIDDERRQGFRDDPESLFALRNDLDYRFASNFSNIVVDANSPQLKVIEELCRQNLESVEDLELRERLRPTHRAACKRLIMSPHFYQAMQRPNARLVTESIDRIESAGIRTADGEMHELDVIVLATGFRVDRFLRPIEVLGRGGVSLDDVWTHRPSAYLSVCIPDFPNLFLLNGPNGPVGNFPLIGVAEAQFDYLMQLVDLVRVGKAGQVSPTRAAAERFEAERVEATKNTIWVTGCRSWYLDDRGIPAAWPWSFDRFREVMESPELSDFELV